MEKLELIKTAHVIDRGLAALSAAVTAESLKRRVASLHVEWQELAYAITAHLCGVESALAGSTRRKTSRKRTEIAEVQIHEEPDLAASENADPEMPGKKASI